LKTEGKGVVFLRQLNVMVLMQVSAAIAAKVVASVSKLGNVLLASMKIGSPPVKISLPKMAIDVRKTTAELLLKDKIESSIGSCKIDGVLDTEDGSCVSAQVK